MLLRSTWPDPLSDPTAATDTVTTVEAIVDLLAALGVQRAFGIVGGANTPFVQALERSSLDVAQFKHEGGAAFAATEAFFESDRPTVLFVTTGPGLLNGLSGIAAARYDGAKLIVVSGGTAPAQRYRYGIQESHADTLPPDLYVAGRTFDFACRIEDPVELEVVYARLAIGMQQPGAFVAHIALPTSLQLRPAPRVTRRPKLILRSPAPCPVAVAEVAAMLQSSRFAIWLGFGARHAANEIRELAHRMSAPVICSARAKGVFDEHDSLFAGHTGVGGSSGTEYAAEAELDHLLVLGSRIGEGTSFWDHRLLPRKEIIHVDVDARCIAGAFPSADTLGIVSEVRPFVAGLLTHLAPRVRGTRPTDPPRFPPDLEPVESEHGVRPTMLMSTIQEVFVDGSDAVLMSEAGNSFSWANEYLRFSEPGRYRTSSTYGSMGHFSAGVVGAAICARRKCVVVTGDGALLMNNEINTAVTHDCDAVWIVLNDARYGMVEHGTTMFGNNRIETCIERVDFAKAADAMGACGLSVRTELGLKAALVAARDRRGCTVVDIWIDERKVAPLVRSRGASLLDQT